MILKKAVVLGLMFVSPMLAQGRWAKKVWKVSSGFLMAASISDGVTSYGRFEGNPVLRGQDGRFGVKGFAIKGAIVGVSFLVERKLGEKHYKASSICNFALAGTMGWFAYHNTTIPKGDIYGR